MPAELGRATHPQLEYLIEMLSQQGVLRMVHIPLIARGEMIGLFNLGLDEDSQLSQEHLELSRDLADVLAIAIQQARLYEAVEHHSFELEERVIQRTAELENKNRELETFAYSVSHDLKALRLHRHYSRLLLDVMMIAWTKKAGTSSKWCARAPARCTS
jgi:GAF domain-containing protein